METVHVKIPAELYTAIYAHYEEETSGAISGCLKQLVDSNAPEMQSHMEGTSQYPRPGSGTITGRVWEIADRLFEETGKADRSAVVEACLRERININTASTQYSYWKKSEE